MSALRNRPAWIAGTVVGILLLGALAARFAEHLGGDGGAKRGAGKPVPVEVAPVRTGDLVLRRTFSGTIEAWSRFTVSPKVNGRIRRLLVDTADPVTRGQVVAELEDEEFRQSVAEAEARRAVARAQHAEAESRMEIARREFTRAETLLDRGVSSESALDSASAAHLAAEAARKVAAAAVQREEAALAAARIRLGYTVVTANWEQGDDSRVVAERFSDEGTTVAAGAPLYSIVDLDPVLAVIQVTERDYPRLAPGQPAVLHVDAFEGVALTGTVSRIAPVFRAASRQARVEVKVPNPDATLKPGMFARCTLSLVHVEGARSVPELAIARRSGQSGVFQVTADGASVRWVPVQPGIQEGDQVELVGATLDGRVVTLGQQLVEDGSAVRVASESGMGEAANTP